MHWKKILDSLYNYFVAQNVADIVLKGFGDAEGINISDKTIACVTRATESYSTVYNEGEGTCTFYIDLFAQYSSPDMSDGYEVLNDLETKVFNAIKSWANQDMPSQEIEIMETRISQSGGNLDVHRPIIGSYLTIEIDWSMRTL